jgi:hypothetical protein
VTPVVPPATIAKDGDEESVEPARFAPVEILRIGAVPPIEETVTAEPEVTPVGEMLVSGVNEYVSELGALDERLQITDKLITVPFGTVNALSKLKFTVCDIAAVRVEPLTTREPVLRAVEPFQIWHELK